MSKVPRDEIQYSKAVTRSIAPPMAKELDNFTEDKELSVRKYAMAKKEKATIKAIRQLIVIVFLEKVCFITIYSIP